ncbi:MAG: 50S ribosomal protein L11 methyltransferase [Syntrophales bacterium]
MPNKWLKIELSIPSPLVDAVSNFVMEIGAKGVFQEELDVQSPEDLPEQREKETLKAYLPCDARVKDKLTSLKKYTDSLSRIFPHLEKASLTTEEISNQDWGEQWKKFFKPLRIGRNIVIKPTWERYPASGRDLVIDIDPGMAFGTGQHPSTRMCMQAMEEILLTDRTIKNWRVLDVGTGTGILGITSVKLGAHRAVCVDIDKKATDIALENAKINRVENRIEIINRDVSTIRESFDLVIANLTAQILKKLCNHLISVVEPGGYLLLSGIMELEEQDIQESFLTSPCLVSHKIIKEKDYPDIGRDWVCYVLRKRSE